MRTGALELGWAYLHGLREPLRTGATLGRAWLRYLRNSSTAETVDTRPVYWFPVEHGTVIEAVRDRARRFFC